MATLEKRLEALEKQAIPTRPQVFPVLEDGVYSVDGKEITPAELAELERTNEVIILQIIYEGDPD